MFRARSGANSRASRRTSSRTSSSARSRTSSRASSSASSRVRRRLAPPFELDEEAETTQDANPQLTPEEGKVKTKIVLKDCRVILAE